MKKKKIIWGIFLLLTGAYLIVSRLGYAPVIGPFTILFTISCIIVIIDNLPKLNFSGILFPLAILCILYDKPLHITALTPWTIILVAILVDVGLTLIFSPVKKNFRHSETSRNDFSSVEGENVAGEKINLHSNFGGLLRYITSDNLKYVELSASFSGVKLYFDGAQVPSGNVTLDINSKFSGIELYIPKSWNIVNQVEASFGSADMKECSTKDGNITITLMGNVSFGAVEIHYV